jgi:hypothetical protein
MTVEKVYTAEIQNVIDLISNVVTNVRAEYDTGLEKPYYQHGHPLEILNTLKEYTANATLKIKKFPLIALLEDFVAESRTGVFQYIAKPDVLIITDTKMEYKASDRYTNSFDAVLTPLYDLFMKYLIKQAGVHVQHKTVPHQRINHLYWGREGLYRNVGNVFNDHIDAIEIKGLNLKIYR